MLVSNAHVLAPVDVVIRSIQVDFDLREQADGSIGAPPPVRGQLASVRSDPSADVAVVRLEAAQPLRPVGELAEVNVAPGSPVFDDAFRVVGMHRKWVELPGGRLRNQGVGLPALRAALARLTAGDG